MSIAIHSCLVLLLSKRAALNSNDNKKYEPKRLPVHLVNSWDCSYTFYGSLPPQKCLEAQGVKCIMDLAAKKGKKQS